MASWVMRMIHSAGSPAIALLMFIENVFPPIPSELIMPLAGFLAARERVSFWGAVIAGTAGSLLGATAWYVVGRRMGERGVRRWVDAHGRWLGLHGRDIDRAQQWFRRRGGRAVLIGRLIPGVRTFISVPAGFSDMPVLPFLLYSLVGSALWTLALAWAGRLLGGQYELVSKWIGPVSWVVLGAILVMYIVRVVRWRSSEAR